MAQGYLALVLHTHLPFVRHPEFERPLEERWLHEALCECYLPMLAAFDRLERDGVRFALTMSLTPPLAAMLKDQLLGARFDDHLARLEALAAKEQRRLKGDPFFGPVAAFYAEHFAGVRATWEAIGHDVVGAFVRHHDAGRLDLITCSATHAYLPGLMPVRDSLIAQLELGVTAFEHLTGRMPLGMWLPECAYDPSYDADIARAGIRYTILDTHGLTRASPRPPFKAHQPIVSPSGTAFFARDIESSRQVWSREVGYPGNPYYRDFYRDIGYDLPEDELMGEVGPFGARVMTGLKYHRITGKTAEKLPYQPGVAAARARLDAGHFLGEREAQIKDLAATMPMRPLVVAPYDSELFGHWWFEGPQFLEALFRHAHAAYQAKALVLPVTLRDYLAREPTAVVATPSASSWGAGGYGEVWVGPAAARFWRHIHHASRDLPLLVRRHADADGERGRALDLAIRQLLLLQTSDWPFILKTETVAAYAESRIRSHAGRLRRLVEIVEHGAPTDDERRWMADLDGRDNFLATLPSKELRAPYLRSLSIENESPFLVPWSAMKRRLAPVTLVALFVGLCAVGGGTAHAAWPPDPSLSPADLKDPANWPNDPGWGYVAGSSSQRKSGQWNLYSWQPDHSPGAPMMRAEEADKPSGISVDAAWRHTIGDPRVLISVMDSGIEWDDPDLVDKAYLNLGELKNHPPKMADGTACGGAGALAGFDCNGDGVVTVGDYKDTPTLTPAASAGHPQGDRNNNGQLDAGDLIQNFSDGTDDDANGYVDDISGWDFFKDDNDPYDDNRYGHGTGEAGDSTEAANNMIGDAGVCPLCRFVPLRVGDSFIADGNDFAQAVVYATDNGVTVIQEALGAINNPLFAQQALGYAWSHHILVVASMADENSRHHNPPATNVFTMPVHAIVNDGNDSDPTTAKSDLVFNTCTNYGAQNYLSVSGKNCSSEATGKGAGSAGLIYSAALQAGITDLTADEAMQLFIGGADDIDVAESQGPNPAYQWSQPGFDQRFGYGRMNVNTSVENLIAGRIPPAVQITSPRWFENVYPSRVGGMLAIDGYVSASRAMSYDYTLEWAPGVQPLDAQFKTIGTPVTNVAGSVTSGADGAPLFTVDLSQLDPTAPPDSDSPNGENQYTITLRLSATAHYGGTVGDVHGELRRAIQVQEDEDLLPGFPIRTDASDESSVKLADLDGDGVRDVVMADSSGRVHAWKATGGAVAELPGFPYKTKTVDGLEDPPAADEPNYRGGKAYQNGAFDLDVAREALVATIAIGDLDGDGSPEIVGTSWAGTTYAIHKDGTPVSGYPVRMPYVPSCPTDPSAPAPTVPCMTDGTIITRGAMGSPVLADLNGDGKLDILQPGFDGRLYAYDGPTGQLLPGYPILVHYSGTLDPGKEHNRIITTPTVHDFDGDGTPDILTGSNEKLGDGGFGAWHLLDGRGTLAPGADPQLGLRFANWPQVLSSLDFLPVVGEGVVDSGATADFDGDGKSDVIISGLGSGPFVLPIDPGPQKALSSTPGNQLPHGKTVDGDPKDGLQSDFGEDTKVPVDLFLAVFGQPAIGDLDLDGTPDVVTTGAGAGLAASQATHSAPPGPSGHRLAAWSGKTGQMFPASPMLLEDFTFFNNPAIADVSGDGFPEILTGTGAYLVHALDACGREAPGFPKNTGQWVLGSVAVGDIDGDGTLEAIVNTRDGFVYAWHTKGKADGVVQWESFHHDNRNTGDYAVRLDQGTLGAPQGKLDCSASNTTPPHGTGGSSGAAGASGASGQSGAAGTTSSGAGGGAAAGPPAVVGSDGGCNCQTAGSDEAGAWLGLGGLVFALRGLKRRRRA